MPILFWVLGGFGAGSVLGLSVSNGLNKLLLLIAVIAAIIFFRGGL
ncbi:hypothetical protein L1D14_09100 [Vibrio tubiashii]|nr:hypothetical protein [Vibrio tubiashii]MCG9576394.1 hypothetical protein [Vibrio tubiashii]